jgi:D-aspartate ligase
MSLPEPAPAAVIVGLDCITGLQSARILARRGVPVIGIAADKRHFCARTRVPRRVIRAQLEGEPLVRALEELAPSLPPPGKAFLLPCTDAAVLTLSRARDRLLEHYSFVLPDHETVGKLMDKVHFAEHVQSQGLPAPRTFILRRRRDVLRAGKLLQFPAVVKPRLKTALWLASTRAKAFRVSDAAELLGVYERACRWSDVLLAQEWVEGGEEALFSCNAYYDRQTRPLATFIARKIRQWPLDTGTSSLGIEARDDTVLQISDALFTSVGYRGLCYLEVKRDSRTGAYAIIEPNLGRPTGRSAIAERGGVELLLTAYSDALGLPLPTQRKQSYRGVKWIYWRHDLQAALVRFRRRELTVAEWWRSVSGPSIEAVGSLRDPLPFVADLAQAAGQIPELLVAGLLAPMKARSSRSADGLLGDRDDSQPEVVK